MELTENRRQATELQRRIAGHLAEGRAADAVALLAESGRLQSFDDARDARIALVTAWAEAEPTAPGRNLMLAHDRHDVVELNRLAREWRGRWGFMSDRRIVARGTEWAIGDRMVYRRNDYALGVRNGTRGTVVDLGRRAEHLDLLTDHGDRVRIPADYLTHARHGYALTGHVSQGESVDRTFVLASPDRGGAEWAYVAASRQRHDLQVFVVHHEVEAVDEALARAWSRSQAKSLALDLVEPAHRDAAMEAAHDDLDRATPERLLARADELRARREVARGRLRATGEERRQREERRERSSAPRQGSSRPRGGASTSPSCWSGRRRGGGASAPSCRRASCGSGRRSTAPARRVGRRATSWRGWGRRATTRTCELGSSRPSSTASRIAWCRGARSAIASGRAGRLLACTSRLAGISAWSGRRVGVWHGRGRPSRLRRPRLGSWLRSTR